MPADPSLYCLPLLSTVAAPLARGIAILHPAPGPFAVTVTREGRSRHAVELILSGLPDPKVLGYREFVAWATTPELEPMMRLGAVRNGQTTVGPIDLERFIIMVSAESSAKATERSGPLVLRGSSPSLLMLPHGTSALPPQPPAPHDHEASHSWSMPPHHPLASRMPSGLERFQPDVAPFLPRDDSASLQDPKETLVYHLADGDTLTLSAVKVRHRHRGHTHVMYAYNGQIPGPRLELEARATITVRFLNRTDVPSSIHWHGLRLANASDGVPGLTQAPVPPGGEFVYRVYAPDPGLFWYHPHQREDITQDLGLAGNIMVRPAGARGDDVKESFLLLDDLLEGASGPVPYGDSAVTHALMGRFGNRLLVNGKERWHLTARPGERVRLHLTNTANARTFNFSVVGAHLRVIAGDAGSYGNVRAVESVVIAPAERYVVELDPPRKGRYPVLNQVRGIDRVTGRFFGEIDTLGFIQVQGAPVTERDATESAASRTELKALMERFHGRPPDRTLLLTLRVRNLPFALIQALRLDTAYVQPVEWTSSMPMMDWLSTGNQVSWILRDSISGTEGMGINWRVTRGEPLVVRLINDRHVLHPMAHPIHLHGQRFLVLARNGARNTDPVWKDTVLVPAGGTTDLLIDTGNPGRWMLHCHIAEHLESGMHTVVTIGESGEGGQKSK
ncbi:MAG TPA: multicopper oxidase family protein [Gemmatimonadales bacterium]|nr:multicopper oxidase family protein [Gemmatimonadales bacterium]